MRIDTVKLKKLLLKVLPYLLFGLFCTHFGQAWRMAEGTNASERLLSFFQTAGAAFRNPLPSLHPVDLLTGLLCGAGLRAAVYVRGKNAKHFRHNIEYGSARWGNAKDIEPFIDPVFANNVILTKTERLMMSNRPKNPANARNKNVLIVGGSGLSLIFYSFTVPMCSLTRKVRPCSRLAMHLCMQITESKFSTRSICTSPCTITRLPICTAKRTF